MVHPLRLRWSFSAGGKFEMINTRKMKKLRYINMLLIALLITAVSCDPDDEPSTPDAKELAFQKLSGAWTLKGGSSIKLDGINISANYPGFSIQFTEGGYTTTNAGDLLNATGSWTWLNDEAGVITLGDDKEVTIVTLTEIFFKFTFVLTDTGGEANDVNGASGNYEVIVEK
jgi:hypothetical protein